MGFIVVYDACVLFPAPQRDLLIRVAMAGVIQAKWTDEILDECFRAILERRPNLAMESLGRTRELMNRAVRDALVTDYSGLADHLSLPDAGDRHVVAAALRCGAQAVITANLKDFPASVLRSLGIEAIHPDQFILDLLDLAPGVVLKAIADQHNALKNPPRSLSDLLATLENNGLVRSIAEVRRLMGMDG